MTEIEFYDRRDGNMVVSQGGHWVKIEDHLRVVESMRKEIEDLEQQLEDAIYRIGL
jgi:hypothetical protein